MATLTIRHIDPEVQKRLRVRAAQNGRSMEAELREIVKEAVRPKDEMPDGQLNLAEAIHRIFAPLGGVELDLPSRGPDRPPPDFDE